MAPSQKRLELHALFVGLLNSPHVYFQQPPNTGMHYPCIIYAYDNAKTEFADNHPYSRTKRYAVTYITRDPDDLIPDDIAQLPLSNLNRIFPADNLHHYVFNLYY